MVRFSIFQDFGASLVVDRCLLISFWSLKCLRLFGFFGYNFERGGFNGVGAATFVALICWLKPCRFLRYRLIGTYLLSLIFGVIKTPLYRRHSGNCILPGMKKVLQDFMD